MSFAKKFKFNGECHLPAESVFFSSSRDQRHEQLQIVKNILNHVKSKLNNYLVEDWSRHTRNRNPAQQIVQYLKNEVQAEFVTQAWAKFYECVNAYPLVNDVGSVFQSVHLCEAPGAFVAALNHYLKLHHPETEFRWRASTLNPYFEGNSITNTILDDRLISLTLENWMFGEDYDGDILQEGNIRSLISYCRSLEFHVQLVTGDGSIDCLDQPENQEEFVANLHMAEVIVGLAILADKGSMVIKMFTFYEISSISLLYILNCCFDDVNIFKPATSKEGNSEVYVICTGFKKSTLSEGIIEKMIVNFKDEMKSLLPLDAIPEEFVTQVHKAACFFMTAQVSVIEGNIRTYKKYDRAENEMIKRLKSFLVEEYVNLYNVSPIREDQKLLHGLPINNDLNLNVRVHSGSHSQRMEFHQLSRRDQQQVLIDRLQSFDDSNTESTSSITLYLPESEIFPANFIKPILGRPIERVVSSKFLLVSLVKYLIEVRNFFEQPDEEFAGKKVNEEANRFVVEMDYFIGSKSYDAYEKEVIDRLLTFLLNHECDAVIIEGLPLFTQFVVGVVLFLSLFVFREVELDRSSSCITFKSIKPEGKENLQLLIATLDTHKGSSRALLGICDTKQLFSLSQQFYKSVTSYNNSICLKFCSFYLHK